MGSPGFELESPVRYFRTEEQAVPRAPQRCQEIPVEQMSGGALARMQPDLSVSAALGPPGGNAGVAAAPGAWQARAA
ncbi:MAG: hypothetical protein WAK82_16010 [Streptosporangiaceae bacterium]